MANPKPTKNEKTSYEEYVQSMESISAKPRSQTDWVKHYRATQRRLKREKGDSPAEKEIALRQRVFQAKKGKG